jgi:lipoprotein-anchoring transpeptidase ErfK/SrfK
LAGDVDVVVDAMGSFNGDTPGGFVWGCPGRIATSNIPWIGVFDAPNGHVVNLFSNPWFINNDPAAPVPLVFDAISEIPDWVMVLLPIRPNGATGWVRAVDVTLSSTPFHILVQLGAHQLTVFDGPDVILTDTVAVGAPDTPTPLGHFFIRALLIAPNPFAGYGPFAYGLSGFSEVLQEFSGGDAEVGLHGNNDTSALGRSVSHGCIRMSNAAITYLTSILPLGVPVDIVA